MIKSNFFAALLVCTLLLPGVAFAQSTMSSSNSSQPTSVDHAKAIVDPGKIYNAKDPTQWVGKSVTLKNVTVQDTNDSGNFWVGSDSDHRLLVVKPENDPHMAAMHMHKGDIVTVSAIVHPASDYMASQTSAERGSMNDAKSSSGVFLIAENISITSSTQR